MIVSRPKSARRAHPVWSTSMFALAGKLCKMAVACCEKKKTHPLKVPMDDPLAMDVNQAPSNTSQLNKLSMYQQI